jgi:DNA polymerase-3 subunit epsilon
MGQFDSLVASFPATIFTVFDTETTGLDARLNRVVEIGGIRFDERGIRSRFNVLINPKMPMPAEVTKINGITDSMLADKPEAKIVLPDFLRFIGDTVLIAHNAPFDVNFINEELSRLGLPLLKNRVLDTRIFAKEVFPGLPKYSLQELAVKFSIEAKDAHRAEDDARVCMELFLVCMRQLREKNPHLVKAAMEEAKLPKDEQSLFAQIDEPKEAKKAVPVLMDDLFADEMDEEEDFIDETPD